VGLLKRSTWYKGGSQVAAKKDLTTNLAIVEF
jgi:hypothetical protein